MTIGGALSDLNNLLNADDIPCYYKPSIKAVMDTIALEQEPKSEWEQDHEILKAYSDGANEVIDKIKAEIGNHCGLTKEKHCRYCSYCHSVMGVREILEIIDKIQGRK